MTSFESEPCPKAWPPNLKSRYSAQNILISGGTGTGKTTLLNILAGYIPTISGFHHRRHLRDPNPQE